MKALLMAIAAVVSLAVAVGTAEGHAVETMSLGGDKLKIKKTYKNGSTIKFCVSKSRSAVGLRALKVIDKDGASIALIEVSDSAPGPICASFNRRDIMDGFRFELFKRNFSLFNSFLSGTDVGYSGAPPLERMDFHWLKGD